jgi:hypothetical protein
MLNKKERMIMSTKTKKAIKIGKSKTYPVFVPTPAGKLRWESVTLTPVSEMGENAYDQENKALWERYPQIPPQIWKSYYGSDIAVMERDGYTPVVMQLEDLLHRHSNPIPSEMQMEVIHVVASRGEGENMEWLLYLAHTDLRYDEAEWDNDELIEDTDALSGGQFPWSLGDYLALFVRVPRVAKVIRHWRKTGEAPLPFLRWTLGQSAVLAVTEQTLDQVRGESSVSEIFAVETTIQGFNNHF